MDGYFSGGDAEGLDSLCFQQWNRGVKDRQEDRFYRGCYLHAILRCVVVECFRVQSTGEDSESQQACSGQEITLDQGEEKLLPYN